MNRLGGFTLNKWSTYLLKISWFIGLILISIIIFNYENVVQLKAAETFNVTSMYWLKPVFGLTFGIYISLLLVKNWTLKFNGALFLCVFVPSIIITFAVPLWSFVFKVEFPPNDAVIAIFTWLTRIYSANLFGIIAGITLILSIFNGTYKKDNS